MAFTERWLAVPILLFSYDASSIISFILTIEVPNSFGSSYVAVSWPERPPLKDEVAFIVLLSACFGSLF